MRWNYSRISMIQYQIEGESGNMGNRVLVHLALLVVLALGAACSSRAAAQPPDDYLANALDWIEGHAISAGEVDFAAVRLEALALAPAPANTADTHPAILRAIAGLGDGLAFLYSPLDPAHLDPGIFVSFPELVVTRVAPKGPGEKAGIRPGDRLLMVNGAAPRPVQDNPASYTVEFGSEREVRLTLQREGESNPVEVLLQRGNNPGFDHQAEPTGRSPVAGANAVAYLDLIYDPGSGPYPGRVQRLMEKFDVDGACGWIVDLRHNTGGNVWSYIAALGPLLGEGDAGGFVYADERRDTWSYRGGKVYWNKEERGESLVEGGIYTPRDPAAPIAFLTSYTTIAAGELVVIAFEGRPGVRVFGEPTRGLARLADHTPLSDGAELFVSGAYATDRTGKRYDAPIQPDEFVTTDWAKYGTDEDPVVRAAAAYLAEQPECKGQG
jgi:carboxyl-terminal processing protease